MFHTASRSATRRLYGRQRISIAIQTWRAILDTVVGNTPAYHNVDARFKRLTDAAGGNPYLGVNTAIHDPTGRPAMFADAMRFDEDTAYQIVYYSYADGRAPTRDAL